MDKISVIMAVYNEQEKLMKSVPSILNQTYRNLEFIICDDGSDDQSADILRRFAQQDARIRLLFHEKNMGHAFSLNHCLKYADGKYIARMDADDESLPERLQVQVDFLDTHPDYDFCGTNILYLEETGKSFCLMNPQVPEPKDFLWGTCFCHPTVVFRSGVPAKVGGYRTLRETRRCEDYDLFMRMYAQGLRGYNIQQILYHYYYRDKNNHSFQGRYYEAKIRFQGFKALGLLPKGFLYVVKPFLAAMIPDSVIKRIRRKRYQNSKK